MTEGERIAELIYRAWIAPVPDAAGLADFTDALQLYADARERDRQAARLEAWKQNVGLAVSGAASEPAETGPDDPHPGPPDTHTHTHTHTHRGRDQ